MLFCFLGAITMAFLVPILLLILGFVILIVGADWLVAGASSLAKRMGLSEMAIGLTIVAMGTSAPEFVVSLISAFRGATDVAFANVIGSNIFNLLLILGVSGMIHPLVAQRSSVWREIPFSLFAALLLFVLANDQLLWGGDWSGLGRVDAAILLVFFLGFLYYVFSQLQQESSEHIAVLPSWKMWGMLLVGISGLVLGGTLVVENARQIAMMAGMSDRLIGLTIVAGGTSLPELATSAMAAYRQKSDIAIGNVIGSNIFNILFILTAGAFIIPTPYNSVMNNDLYLLGISTFVLWVFLASAKDYTLMRWEAAFLLCIFGGYLFFLIRYS